VTGHQVFDRPGPARAATARRVWHRRQAGQTVLLAMPPVMLAFVTVFIAGVAGAVEVGLILGAIELVLSAILLVALSPQIMLRSDEVRIWRGFRFTNIGISEVAGIGMLYVHNAGYGGYWRLFLWREDGSFEGTSFSFLLGRSPRLAPGKDDGTGPARLTTTRSQPRRSRR
jgi:hypothetical protein